MSKTSKEMKPYLSTGEIAHICHMSRASVFNWIKTGKLKASRVPGGKYKIFRRDFLGFMKKADLLALVEEDSRPRETRILIVDNQPEIIETIKTFIEKNRPNFYVTGTTSGFEAGQLVHSFKPDVVILDIVMPEIDGFTVCRKIKSEPTTRGINVIAVTGYPSEKNIERIKKEGASVCLTKPLNFDELLNNIEDLVQTH
jgi:excisionase family DNA binding protein